MSRQLKIPASRIEIVSGHTGRNKKVLIRHPEGHDPEQFRRDITDRLAELAHENINNRQPME